MERFLSRGGGFCSRGSDSSMESLGLSDMVPSHHFRPFEFWCFLVSKPSMELQRRLSCDVTFRHLQKTVKLMREAPLNILHFCAILI